MYFSKFIKKPMIYVLLIFALGIILSSILIFKKKKAKECFSVENFDKATDYTRWKEKTSKIGKVLVDGYRVELSPENILSFKHDKENYTIFRVTRDNGIILLPIKQKNSLKRKANNAFCSLVERALIHPINPVIE